MYLTTFKLGRVHSEIFSKAVWVDDGLVGVYGGADWTATVVPEP